METGVTVSQWLCHWTFCVELQHGPDVTTIFFEVPRGAYLGCVKLREIQETGFTQSLSYELALMSRLNVKLMSYDLGIKSFFGF